VPILFAKAPGKIILFGEHAVVYGQPAIAIPIKKINATARVFPNPGSQPNLIHIQAPDIQMEADLSDLPDDHPIACAVQLAVKSAQLDHTPALTLQVTSTIPISAGMGSSAAISVAVIRALTDFLGHPLQPDDISQLAYEVEKIQHGTPSGIDNNVIAHGKPIYFSSKEPIQFLQVEQPTHWVIADSGEKTPTHETVAFVRTLYNSDPDTYQAFFKKIGKITQDARHSLVKGDVDALGKLMDENQHNLALLGVSSPKLNGLISAAKDAGAAGAKLSGGGRGGNIIALTLPEKLEQIETALRKAGAQRVITATLARGEP
jgi:mevalonate kinase